LSNPNPSSEKLHDEGRNTSSHTDNQDPAFSAEPTADTPNTLPPTRAPPLLQDHPLWGHELEPAILTDWVIPTTINGSSENSFPITLELEAFFLSVVETAHPEIREFLSEVWVPVAVFIYINESNQEYYGG